MNKRTDKPGKPFLLDQAKPSCSPSVRQNNITLRNGQTRLAESMRAVCDEF